MLVDVPIKVAYPNLITQLPTTSAIRIDGDGDKAAIVFEIPTTGNLTQVGLSLDVVGANNSVAEIRLETVDPTTGAPTGTLYNANSFGSVTIHANNSYSVVPVSLNATIPCSRGDIIALVTARQAGTGDFNLSQGTANSAIFCFPYTLDDLTVGSWTKRERMCPLSFNINGVYQTSPDGWIGGSYTLNNSTNPSEIGQIFVMPYRARLTGLFVIARALAPNAEYFGKLYKNPIAGPQLLAQTYTYDTEVQVGGAYHWRMIRFTEKVIVEKGEKYAMVVGSNNATAITQVYGDMSAFGAPYGPFGAYNANSCTAAYRANTSDPWTVRANSFLWIALMLDQIDDGYQGGIRNFGLRPWGNR